jgi:hypothetical protein
MGLDLYFYAKQKVTGGHSDTTDAGLEIGYFRKFNALFHWVETHIQPIENCVDIPVSKKDLIKLQETLNQLTPQNCTDLFPTQNGFFFGSTDYDEAYWGDVGDLKILLDKILGYFDFTHEQIYFHAWW